MILRKFLIINIVLILLLSPVLNLFISSAKYPSILLNNDELDFWDDNWSFRQEIILPISTDNEYAVFQPIDIKIVFDNPCWAKNEILHSIRVCCWDGKQWDDLESQIYNLNSSGNSFITRYTFVSCM